MSILIIAYQQAEYIAQTISSALSQDYPNLEIIVSDDSSPDDTYLIAKSLENDHDRKGKLRVVKTPENLGKRGLGNHMNWAMPFVTGDLVVMGGGDDLFEPTRVSMLVQAWQNAGCPSCVIHSDAIFIDENGQTIPGKYWHASDDLEKASLLSCFERGMTGILGATLAFSRDLWTAFGPLPENTYFEDRVLGFRAKLAGRILHVKAELVRYRRTQGSLSGEAMLIDPARWAGWVEGVRQSVEAQLNDCAQFRPELMTPQMEQAALRRRRWVGQISHLHDAVFSKRVIAAWVYSKDATLRDRISFVAHRSGIAKTFAYLKMAAVWRWIKTVAG